MKKLLLLSLSVVLVFACVMLGACDACASGHTFGEWNEEVAATCTNAGTKGYKECTVCHKYFDADDNEIAELTISADSTAHVSVTVDAVEATCTKEGYTAGHKCSLCNTVIDGVEKIDALGHDFDETALNYVTYTACSRKCGAYKILDSKKIYDADFVYDFNAEKQAEIDGVYDELIALLDGTSAQISGAEFDEKFEVYDDFVSYIQYQYQVGQILNDRDYTAATQEAYSDITEYYYDIIAKYYGLFQLIYDSSVYKDYFYKDWTQEDIEEVLQLAASYDAENRTEAEKITEEYEEWYQTTKGLSAKTSEENRYALFSLYNRLVIANNNIAINAGYDNYMDYAYANVYDRDYKPEDVVNMRDYVREYIGPIAADTAKNYISWARSGSLSSSEQWYYDTYSESYVFRNVADTSNKNEIKAIVNARQSLSDYFAFLSENADDTHDSFSQALSDLFENGNYFFGKNPTRTAYAWYIYEMQLPVLLFTSKYQVPFTLVHEFGHYYQFIYNGTLGVCMDHDETQSQGNEMLYLAWLKKNMPSNVSNGFKGLEYEQLRNMLSSIVLSTAVDEFEYLVYTGATTYNGEPIATVKLSDGTTVINYEELYKSILDSYWPKMGSTYSIAPYYWSYVVFDQAAYYISYAMSALPCLEIYAIACNGDDGLENARDSYLKLFTFGSESQFVDVETSVDEDGETHTNASLKAGVTYQDILNWAGLSGPFQEELYVTIQKYFNPKGLQSQ